ncbi:hypothetical protein [Streptomyces sp. G-G2]|uniref:hypothetical protein n=1 Tax=Streptomyces sp. G-G2 TaxID=3046201 RepID=UPI0024B8DF3C|nr:hypothetical protein [Streptomyces sp. G-G2]MDJ0383210.1 hypothetical protein [Streptomyces sp. G-G2]
MIDRAPLTAAVRTMLTAATGRPCGLGGLPLVDGRPAPLPYSVLYPLGGLVGGSPFADYSEDACPAFQVTIVGARTDQAEWLADRVRRAFLQRTPAGDWEQPVTAPGLNVWARELLVDEGADPVGGDVVTYIQRYKLAATATA